MLTDTEIRALERNKAYWRDRELDTQERLEKKTLKQTQAQMRKYYKSVAKTSEAKFRLVYNELLNTMKNGLQPTPADMYRLDKYWKLQTEMKALLKELGDKETRLYGNGFAKIYKSVYDSLALKDDTNFNYLDLKQAEQMINQVWCADGKQWKERIWMNNEKLHNALNDGLMECVISGADPKQLTAKLMDEFNVAFNRADTLVRTEISHIQTQAAKHRYQDAGLKKVQVWASYDERRCSICGKLHKKVLNINEQMPIPAHPRCRCRIIAYFE